ncbi:uncharacterized protein Z518_00099 [Rhinocladiella mackenziei CBS 650.93]|uniref:Cytochrome P450 n=1 Tax=Rhinocladiella mackenziei CBS 650.93 TaxID=1442369 RepID=A0A0D2J087_9EURO|nr:uncharacterized protein Z518_00099 [Rhinocladiella mackenziei CBS 650.93]KIX09021.1 hypothetical protein Z518_00099 [Rhinocladiella mackenziei CBS 650.93]
MASLGASPTGLVYVFGPVLAVTYRLGLAIWRLYLCPQAEIPGPMLAKLTYWYEFYYDVVLGGQYIWKIRAMHEQYGPIVRINPEEVHIHDADYYDQVYTGPTHKRNKWTFFTNQSGLPQSGFGTPDHNLHRMRRAALNPYFSKAKVRILQPRIESSLNNLLARFREFQESGEPMTVSLAYAALATLTRASKKPIALNPVMASYIKLNKDIIRHVSEIYSHRGDTHSKYNSQTTIFHAILQGGLPEKEMSPDRLWQDGQVVVIAGTLTTAAALSEITYHLLRQPNELKTLKDELAKAIPDPTALPETAKLEQLPYLTAIIKEGLRLSSGISTRLQRIATDETLIYTAKKAVGEKQYVLRPGIPLSMTGLLIHHSPTYFRDPMAFRPQRWIDDPILEAYLVPFSRGTRACVGINLAYAELYLTVAAVFCQYGSREVRFPNDKGFLELYNTSHKDIEIIGDGVTPLYRSDGNGVRIVVHAV